MIWKHKKKILRKKIKVFLKRCLEHNSKLRWNIKEGTGWLEKGPFFVYTSSRVILKSHVLLMQWAYLSVDVSMRRDGG